MGIPGIIRACAFAFVQEEDRVLVGKLRDPDNGSHFYRPLGGGINFGETGEEAVRREFREELGVDLGTVRHIGSFEDIFEMRGEPYHELSFVFLAGPKGWSIDRFDGFAIPESVGPGMGETAVVRGVSDFDDSIALYPEGVLERLVNP